MGAPLTRREARQIERSTGRRPVAEASGPVFDTGEIERNSVTSLVSVVPTEVVGRRGVPMVPVVSEGVSGVEVPAAFVRSVSVRAARPAVLVARRRRRVVAGAAVAASAAALATVAAVVVPGQQEGAGDGVAQADLLSGAQQGSSVPVQPAVVSRGPVSVNSDVAAPAQVQAGYEVTVFSSDQLAEAVAPVPAASGAEGDDASSSSGGSTQTASSGGSGYAGSTVVGSNVIETAMQFQGVVPYGNGNDPSDSFDCSGFVQYVYAQHGVSLPRTVSGQAASGTVVTDPQPGDLVVFGNYHIGIYIGNGQMIDAPDWGRSVEVGGLDAGGSYYFVRI